MAMLVRTLALALSLVAGAAAAEEAALTGSWTATSAERDGAAAPELVGHRLSFDGSGFSIVSRDGAHVYAGTYSLGPDPAAVDFRNVSGEAAGVTWLGLWQLDGATLSIADNAPDPTRPRPAALAAPAGSGYVMLIFARDGG